MVRGQFYGGTDDEDDFDDFDDVVDDFYEDEDDFYDDESVEGSDSENLDGPLKDAPDVDKQ